MLRENEKKEKKTGNWLTNFFKAKKKPDKNIKKQEEVVPKSEPVKVEEN